MATYKYTEVKIPGVSNYNIARALASLAGFGEGTRVCNRDASGREEVIVFHPQTVARDPDLFQATQNPDIEVCRIGEDKYSIEFNLERVPANLVGGIEARIREESARASRRPGSGREIPHRVPLEIP